MLGPGPTLQAHVHVHVDHMGFFGTNHPVAVDDRTATSALADVVYTGPTNRSAIGKRMGPISTFSLQEEILLSGHAAHFDRHFCAGRKQGEIAYPGTAAPGVFFGAELDRADLIRSVAIEPCRFEIWLNWPGRVGVRNPASNRLGRSVWRRTVL